MAVFTILNILSSSVFPDSSIGLFTSCLYVIATVGAVLTLPCFTSWVVRRVELRHSRVDSDGWALGEQSDSTHWSLTATISSARAAVGYFLCVFEHANQGIELKGAFRREKLSG